MKKWADKPENLKDGIHVARVSKVAQPRHSDDG